MSLKFDTKQILKEALASESAANDLITVVEAGGGGGVSGDISVTSVTTSAAATVGTTLAVAGVSTVHAVTMTSGDLTLTAGDVKLATGHVLKVNAIQVVGAQQALVAGITTTYTTGSAPTKGSTQTIADAATPTVVELLQYCANLEGKITAINTALKTHGLLASS